MVERCRDWTHREGSGKSASALVQLLPVHLRRRFIESAKGGTRRLNSFFTHIKKKGGHLTGNGGLPDAPSIKRKRKKKA
jgi:hypothetical protein